MNENDEKYDSRVRSRCRLKYLPLDRLFENNENRFDTSLAYNRCNPPVENVLENIDHIDRPFLALGTM